MALRTKEVHLRWECVEGHANEAVVSVPVPISKHKKEDDGHQPGEDLDRYMEDFCSDLSIAQENPCAECGSVGFNEIDY